MAGLPSPPSVVGQLRRQREAAKLTRQEALDNLQRAKARLTPPPSPAGAPWQPGAPLVYTEPTRIESVERFVVCDSIRASLV